MNALLIRIGTRRGLILLASIAIVVTVGIWQWARESPPPPPIIDVTGVDPEIVQSIETARAEVLAKPRSSAAWGRFGMVLRAHDFAPECVIAFTEAERLDPHDPRWPYLRGLTQVQREPLEGLNGLRRAVAQLDTKPTAPRYRLIELLLEQGQWDEAEAQLREVQRREPNHPRGRLLQARLAVARQDWDVVIALPLNTLDDPHTAKQAQRLVGEAWQHRGDFTRADELFRQAAALPDDAIWPDPYVSEVEALQVGTRLQVAKASGLIREGRTVEAIDWLQRLVREDPANVVAWVTLGESQRRAQRLPEAVRTLTKAVEVGPDSVDAWFQLGVVRSLQNQHQEAAAAFRQVVRIKPDHTLGHHNLGISLSKLDQKEEARAAWRDALRSQPDYAPSRQALAESEGRKQD